jgi:putative ABC transport system ATP-binding protein
VIEVRDAKKWIQNGARRIEILKGISLAIPAEHGAFKLQVQQG